MAVTLRLARHGQTKRPFYRIVATEKESRRDGRFLEVVGTYNPMTTPSTVTFKEEKVRHWLDLGASVSTPVARLMKYHLVGMLEDKDTARRQKIQQRRRSRKERARARAA